MVQNESNESGRSFSELTEESLPNFLDASIGEPEHRPFNPEHDLPWITTGEVISIFGLIWFGFCLATDNRLLNPQAKNTIATAMRSIMPQFGWALFCVALGTLEWCFLYFDVLSWARRTVTSLCFGWWMFICVASFTTQWNSFGVGLFAAMAYAITPRLRWG
jgi:hypothetical protein